MGYAMHVRASTIRSHPSRVARTRTLHLGGGYLVVLALLVLFAVAATAIRLRPVSGLADDADVREARALASALVAPARKGLRTRSALLGEDVLHVPIGEAPEAGAALIPGGTGTARAAALLERARARRPFDPRVTAACATFDLASGRVERADRRFRSALAGPAPYPEARLMLGVTLAERARRERDGWSARRYQLQAIAQFAAVSEDAPEYPHALFNRALLLAAVGRGDEARAVARAYFGIDPDSPWSERLARAVAREG